MADEKDTNQDDDLEIVEVEELPALGAEPAPKIDDSKDDRSDDDDDGEDERLGTSHEEDGDPDSPAGKKAERRRKRREIGRRARERKDQELEALRQQVQQLTQLTTQLHGTQHTSLITDTESRLNQAKYEVQQAEAIMAAALKAQNTEDFVAAQNLRDEARDRARDLEARKGDLEAKKPEPYQQPVQQVDPRVVSYADQWIKANPWYDVNGRDEDSRITKAIDDGLVREGYNPADQDYWLELTKRVAARIGDDTDDPPRRTQQPTGNSREHVPSSTRKQVYVTAERKAAMIEAGVWDDPSKRAKFLKAYQDYDRNSASR